MLTFFLLALSAVGSFHLQDTSGAWHDAAEWNGAKAVVLFFVSIDCPISNS